MFISCFLVREQLKELNKQFEKSENDLKALQSVGQIVGEVLKQLTEDKCKYILQPIGIALIIELSFSHREGNKRASLCRRLSTPIGQDSSKIWYSSRSGHDNFDDYAILAS